MLFLFQRCPSPPRHATALQKLDLDCTKAEQNQHQIFPFHFGQSSCDRCTLLFVILLAFWCEFKAHINCLFHLVLQTFGVVIIDKQAHDALFLGSTTGARIFMQKGRAVLVLLYIYRNFLFAALGGYMEIPKQLI